MTAPMTDLTEMLRALDVEVRDQPYVVATVPEGAPIAAHAEAMIAEREGMTVVVPEQAAKDHGIVSQPLFAWLTLTINSSLEAIGLTAAFSTALADRGISCNVLAGYYHDHLLVAYADRDCAVGTLRSLSGR